MKNVDIDMHPSYICILAIYTSSLAIVMWLLLYYLWCNVCGQPDKWLMGLLLSFMVL